MRALYAFCRLCDDIVDRPCYNAALALAALRVIASNAQLPHAAIALLPPALFHDAVRSVPRAHLVVAAWADVRTNFGIPPRYVEQLVDGVARDLQQTRYATFSDLTNYAYGVASTVGLMAMHIIGFSNPQAIPYAIKLGIALQLTNILRDVAEDSRAGRVYLPSEELAAFGLTEHDLARGQVNYRWRAFMRFQIARNRRLYAEAWPGIALLNRDGRLAVAAAGGLYRAILRDIEAHDHDVFHHRAHVSTWGKLRLLPGIWWHTQGHRADHAAL
jgi:phytoene synthase